MAVQLLHPQYMIWIGIIILIFSIIFTLFLIRYLQKRQKRSLIVAIISCSIIIGAICSEIYLYQDYQYQLHYDILEYSLELESKSGKYEEVYAPISENSDLQNSVKIKSGSGTVSVINSEHSMALKINFSGKIEIYGKIDTTSGIGKHDLTMVNQTEKNIEYWIFYKPSNSSYYNCSFELKLYHESLDWWETHHYTGYLNEGWSTYWASHMALS